MYGQFTKRRFRDQKVDGVNKECGQFEDIEVLKSMVHEKLSRKVHFGQLYRTVKSLLTVHFDP